MSGAEGDARDGMQVAVTIYLPASRSQQPPDTPISPAVAPHRAFVVLTVSPPTLLSDSPQPALLLGFECL